VLFGSTHVKARHKHVGEIDPSCKNSRVSKNAQMWRESAFEIADWYLFAVQMIDFLGQITKVTFHF